MTKNLVLDLVGELETSTSVADAADLGRHLDSLLTKLGVKHFTPPLAVAVGSVGAKGTSHKGACARLRALVA